MTSTSALSGEYFPPIPPIPMARLQPDGTLVPITTAHAQGEMAIAMPALMPASTIETSADANYNAAAADTEITATNNNINNNMQQQQILSLVTQMNAALDANTSQMARMQAEINELKGKCNVLESKCGHLEGINKHKQPIINHQKVNNNTAPQKQKEQASQAQALKPKRKRTNHSKGDSMRQAVEEWDSLQNNQQGEEQPLPTLAQHAAKYGLKKKTLEKYVYKDLTKRRKLGSQSGRKSIVSAETAELLIQQYTATNNSNNNSQGTDCGSGSVNIKGRTATEVRQNLEMLQPDLRPMQARNYIQRTFKKKAAEGRVVATRQTANTSVEVSVPELPEPHWGGLEPGENENEHDEC